MPSSGQRTRLRLAIADDAGDDEIGIVEHRPERMAERIAQLAALVDRARALRRCVAWNSSGKRKLEKELPKPGLILADIGINLAVSALEISIAHDGRAAVPGAGDVNHVEVVFFDDPVQVRVNEVLPWGRSPVSQQHVLHIRERQRPLQQRIVVKINLANRQIVGGAPVCIHLVEQFRGKSLCVHGSILFLSPKAENAANHLGYHEYFVRANDADCNRAGRRGNHAVIRRVSLFVEFDSKEAQPIANPGADHGRVLSYATSEYERVQSAQRRCECADPFLDLVAKQRDRVSRPHVRRFTVEQVTHVGTGLRQAEQPGLEIGHIVVSDPASATLRPPASDILPKSCIAMLLRFTYLPP
jgi:hypothetical protein